jgi:hypothetical protein
VPLLSWTVVVQRASVRDGLIIELAVKLVHPRGRTVPTDSTAGFNAETLESGAFISLRDTIEYQLYPVRYTELFVNPE